MSIVRWAINTVMSIIRVRGPSIYFVDFEQVNVSWVIILSHFKPSGRFWLCNKIEAVNLNGNRI